MFNWDERTLIEEIIRLVSLMIPAKANYPYQKLNYVMAF